MSKGNFGNNGAMRALMRSTDLSTSAKVLAAVVADRFNARRRSPAPDAELAAHGGLGLRTVRRGRKELETYGFNVLKCGQGRYWYIWPGEPVPANLANLAKSPDAPAEAEPPKAAKDGKGPDSRVTEFLKWFAETYERVLGRKYLLSYGKEGALTKRVLATLDAAGVDALPELKRASDVMLGDHWGGPNASISILVSQINRWRGGHQGTHRKHTTPMAVEPEKQVGQDFGDWKPKPAAVAAGGAK